MEFNLYRVVFFVCVWRAQGVSDYFSQLPGVDNPEIFGMHENANVTFNTNESLGLMQTVSTPMYQRRYTGIPLGRENATQHSLEMPIVGSHRAACQFAACNDRKPGCLT